MEKKIRSKEESENRRSLLIIGIVGLIIGICIGAAAALN